MSWYQPTSNGTLHVSKLTSSRGKRKSGILTITMDTRSSSGSRSTDPTQGCQPPEQQTYTTAGTVYNPQIAPPLQPPARRGRAMRWPPAIPSDLSAFNNSMLSPFPRNRYRSPPTTASTLKHYSPLQQNCHRAVDPATGQPDQKRSISESSFTMSLSSPLPRSLVFGGDKDNNPLAEDTSTQDEENKEEEEELTRMSNYSVKTLTSLASYTNPHQKMAQRALNRARQTFKANENSRPVSPSSSRQGLDGAGPPPFGREGSDYYNRLPRNTHIHNSTRSSVLSSGPGAPQPLTAGPPGQRQYKASTLEGPFRALQASTPKPPSSTIDESHFEINTSSLLNLGAQQHLMKVPDPARTPENTKPLRTSGDIQAHQPAVQDLSALEGRRPWQRVYPATPWVAEPRETRTLDQIKAFYPRGLPPYYNSKNLISVPVDNSDLSHILHPSILRQPLSGEARKQTDARHRAAFYSGRDDLYKTWDQRVEDVRKTVRDRELGISDSTDRAAGRRAETNAALSLSQLSKPEDIDVRSFAQMQTGEAAQPLLGMAFSTLCNYWDNGRLMSIPTGFAKAKKLEEDLWARSRSSDNCIGRPKSHNKWGLPQTPPPPSPWTRRSGAM